MRENISGGKLQVTPIPSEDEIAAIAAAVQSLLATSEPYCEDASSNESNGRTDSWRFSSRWWSNKRFLPKAQFGPTFQ